MVDRLMLYMIGTLTLDTRPFSADEMDRTSSADLAQKAVIGGLAPSEFMGEGSEEITLSGRLLPTKIGGLTELEIAHEMRRRGARVPLMRGDGVRLGTYAIVSMEERHRDLTRSGVGFTIRYSVTLRKVPPDTGSGQQVVAGLLSLFAALG